eukprot:1032910-Prymnesium_polylepis.2
MLWSWRVCCDGSLWVGGVRQCVCRGVCSLGSHLSLVAAHDAILCGVRLRARPCCGSCGSAL